MICVKEKYKITYEERLTKTSIVLAEGEADAVQKWEDNEDTKRELINGQREIKKIREVN